MKYKRVDNGSVAFGDPLQASEKREAKKIAVKSRNDKRALKAKKNGGIQARNEMHTKFG
jgi:hypothetical protein